MLRTLSRRLTRVAETVPLPLTLVRFTDRVQQRMRWTGESFDSAVANLLEDLSEAELQLLCEECEHAVFGSDTAARDEAKRRVLREYYNATGLQ